MAEAGRLAEHLGAQLLVIHVGKPSEHTHSHLESLMERQHIDGPGCRLVFPSGPPAEAIAETCRQEQIDLLIMGALPSRSLKDQLLGTVAQHTLRKVPCSVLLLADPSRKPRTMAEIAIGTRSGGNTSYLMERTLRLAQCLGTPHVYILRKENEATGEEHLPKYTRRRKLVGVNLQEAKNWLEPFDEDEAGEELHHPEVHVKLYAGTEARAWSEFAHRHPLCLFAVEAPPAEAMGPFWRLQAPGISRLVQELPTNLLLLR